MEALRPMSLRKVVTSGTELVVGGGVVGLISEAWRPRAALGRQSVGNLGRWRRLGRRLGWWGGKNIGAVGCGLRVKRVRYTAIILRGCHVLVRQPKIYPSLQFICIT